MKTRERVQLQPAFLLHQYEYRDTSRIVELFTREYGRVSAMAKGSRRPASKFHYSLRPFQELLVSWSGGELATLTGVEQSGVAHSFQDDALFSGYYLSELLLRLSAKRDPHPQVFDMYKKVLNELSVGASIARSLRLFEKSLLEDLGYGLNLLTEVNSGQKVEPDCRYQYHIDRGPEISQSENGTVHGSSLLSLANNDLGTAEALRDAKRILRIAIDAHLGGRPLKSRQVMQALQR
ncbi:MAG: DNA repair protein RecO [Gammaproteobacteria bacterium]|nr:DNA repair protein RecO [Gammaproteobacteria bacterium]